MRYIREWVNKQLSRSYERSRLKGLPKSQFDLELEKFIDQNRRRIQDLELVVRESAQILRQIKEDS